MRRSQTIRSRAGFTLVEMLVSVTLVLLMMVMFGEVFQLASGSVNKQRVMADNDQNARTVVTVLRADLDKRTFRTLVPFYPSESTTTSVTPFASKREGYFYLNCNSAGDGTDDVLAFTVKSTVSLRNADESPYYGAADQLPSSSASIIHFLRNPNQPNRDDGQVTPFDYAGASRAAEVCYFLRGRRLYRRVMLIRDPIPAPGIDPTNPQPMISEDLNNNGTLDMGEDINGNGVLDLNVDYFRYAGAAGSFWGRFDFSAHMVSPTFPLPNGYAQFSGIEYLRNDAPLTLGPYSESLGQSWNRFGFNSTIVPNSPANGRPREYSAAAAPNFFLGRWTHEETSNSGFTYPQAMPAGGNPMDAGATSFTDAPPSDGIVDAYAGGPRAGVDLLLNNVHEFRVEVWDNRLGDFAPIGHSLPAGAPASAGDYNAARILNGSYGPSGGPTWTGTTVSGVAVTGAFASSFDSWNPLFNRNANTEDTNGNGMLDPGEDLNANGNIDPILGDFPDRPPYRALNWDATLLPAVSGFPQSPNPTPPMSVPNGGTFRRGYWAPGTSYSAGAPGVPPDIVFPCREDLNGNGFLDPGEDGANGFPNDGFLHEKQFGVLSEDLNGNNMLDAGEDGAFGFPVNLSIDRMSLLEPGYPAGMSLCYRCIKSGTSGNTRDSEPNGGAWSTTPGQIIHGSVPAEPDWIVEYNVRPLRALRITIRFEHPTSKQMKQVTLVHSLRDTTSVP